MDVRIRFNKVDEVKYISHLDLLRTFNRMLMRSGLKIAYSQGYNPHILLTFAQPSSVGMTTKNDCADITLSEEYEISFVEESLKKAAPCGIEITKVSLDKIPAFNEVASANYSVNLKCNVKKEDIIEFLKKEEILVDKKTKKGIKEVDIKPLIYNFEIEEREEEFTLKLHLASGSNLNLNPSLIKKAMEKHIDNFICDYYEITRECLISENNVIF